MSEEAVDFQPHKSLGACGRSCRARLFIPDVTERVDENVCKADEGRSGLVSIIASNPRDRLGSGVVRTEIPSEASTMRKQFVFDEVLVADSSWP